jgi:Ca2+/Na+ antiporter
VRLRPDVPSLVAGLAIAALGALLLVDDLDALELDFGVLGPVLCAVLGVTLLASGLSRRT